jgi:hypothetical protein
MTGLCSSHIPGNQRFSSRLRWIINLSSARKNICQAAPHSADLLLTLPNAKGINRSIFAKKGLIQLQLRLPKGIPRTL